MTDDGELEHRPGGARAGEQLRIAREAQNLSLQDVAQRTRIPVRHLALIEDGSYAGLPAPTYSAGFVKSYARLLGLDAQALSEQFRAEINRETVRPYRPEPYEPADPRRTPPIGLAALALVLALVIGLGVLYWRGSQDQPSALAAAGVAAQPGERDAAVSTSKPVLGRPPTAPTAANGPVTIGATQSVWIKVSASGRTVFLGTLEPGKTVLVPPDAVDPILTTGRPGVTSISVGATPIPAVGDPDRAAHDVSLKPEALLARVTAPPPATQPPAGAPTPVTNAAGAI